MRHVLLSLLLVAASILPILSHAEESSGEGAALRLHATARREARLSGSTAAPPSAELHEGVGLKGTVAARRAARMLRAKTERRAVLSTDVTETVLFLTNEERAKEGLPPLLRNRMLDLSATAHAKDMAARNFFSHTNPDGETPTDRIRGTGYLSVSFATCRCTSWRYAVGENIARGQQTPERAVQDWMQSPTHRAAILSKEYREIGIGYADGVWVQNFGLMEKQ